MSPYINPYLGAVTHGLSSDKVCYLQQLSEDLPRVLEFVPYQQNKTPQPGNNDQMDILQWFNKEEIESIRCIEQMSKDQRPYIKYEVTFWDPRIAAELVPKPCVQNPNPSQNLVISCPKLGIKEKDVGVLRWASRAYRLIPDRILRYIDLYSGFSRAWYLLTESSDPSAWPRRSDGLRYLFPWELKNLVRGYHQELTKGRNITHPEPRFTIDSRSYAYVEFYDTFTAFTVLHKLLQNPNSGIGGYEFKKLESFDFEKTEHSREIWVTVDQPPVSREGRYVETPREWDIRRERVTNPSLWSGSPERLVTPPPPYSPPHVSTTAHHTGHPLSYPYQRPRQRAPEPFNPTRSTYMTNDSTQYPDRGGYCGAGSPPTVSRPPQSSLRRAVATIVTDTSTGRMFWSRNLVEDPQSYTIDQVMERGAQGDLRRVEVCTPDGKSQAVYIRTLSEE